MRRIKTYARSVKTEGCFSDLALISMHYKKRVPVDEICRAFAQAHPRKLFQASYLMIVVHRSRNSCHRNLIYIQFGTCTIKIRIDPSPTFLHLVGILLSS